MGYFNGNKVFTVNNTVYMGENLNVISSPQGVDTSTNILAKTSNQGVWVGSDTGHWYYWNGTQYEDGGVYQATEIGNNSITPEKTTFIKERFTNLFPISDINSNYGCLISKNIITTNSLSYNGTFGLNCNNLGIASGTKTLTAGTYYLSLKIKGSVTGGGVAVRVYDNNGNRVNATTLYANVPVDDYGDMMVRFTLNNDVDNFGFMFVNGYNGIIVYNCKDFFMSDNQEDILSYILNNNIFINSNNIIGDFSLNNLEMILEEYNVFNDDKSIVGRYNTDTGAYYPSATNRKCTEFIPVNILKNKVVNVTGTQQVSINEYDEEKNWLRGVITNYQSVGTTYNISSDCVYITLSVPTDYPDFSLIGYRFKKDIEKPKYDIKRILCIGDSLTQGVDYNDHVIAEGYPYFLEKDFDVKTFNHGFMGTTSTTWYSTRMQYVNFNYTFDVALIMLGTNGGLTDTLDTDVIPYSDYNDFANTNTGNYCKIIEKIMQQSPRTQIILMIPPYNYFNEEKHSVLLTAVNVIPKIAELYSLPIIDLYRCSGMNYRNGDIFRPHDNLHFNAKGYHKMATYIGNQLKSLYSYYYDSDVYDDEYND